MSPDALHDLLSHIGDEYPSTWLRLRDHIAALEKERDEWQARALDRDLQVTRLTSDRDQAWAERAKMCAEKHAALADNAARWRIVDLLAPAMAVLSRAPEVAPEIRSELAQAEALFLAGGRSPGATLLEEHRKALVCARNQGLEKAAERISREASVMEGYYGDRRNAGGKGEPETRMVIATLHGFAALIRAMKEPEECTNASCVKCRNGEPCH